MNCWHCGTELIWGADHDMEDVNDGEEVLVFKKLEDPDDK